ncbi:MAG TPA: SGNH/GDSL hydrolase family protein [Candidatus Angelobacter sp.]|nr:SGNH/GDSL hydrolase family protein [Candidatus Angelobacter sp.]
MSEVVLVFGDSIVMGLWDERGGWPERLWVGRSRVVYNLGVDGETSEDVTRRFYSEAESRGANKNSVIIFAVGIND